MTGRMCQDGERGWDRRMTLGRRQCHEQDSYTAPRTEDSGIHVVMSSYRRKHKSVAQDKGRIEMKVLGSYL